MGKSKWTEPKLIASRPLFGDEELRVALSPYRAQTYLSMRRWYLKDGEWLPGKGLSVNVHHLPFLRVALEKAEREALNANLLDEESYESANLPVPRALLGAA